MKMFKEKEKLLAENAIQFLLNDYCQDSLFVNTIYIYTHTHTYIYISAYIARNNCSISMFLLSNLFFFQIPKYQITGITPLLPIP